MPELRHNLITRDWVIIATERKHRPDDFARSLPRRERPHFRADCPFCPGNEVATEHELARIADAHGWRARAVLNKYPVLTPTGERVRAARGVFRSMSGVGVHEVIVDNPSHALSMGEQPESAVRDVLALYRARYLAVAEDPRVECVVLFKNHGEGAGTSLEHPHSQLAATPIVPSQIRARLEEAIRHLDEHGECIFCRNLHEELEDGARIVHQSRHFVAFVPYAALSPFHLWIFPRRHVSSFGDATDEELTDLAGVLRTVLGKLFVGLADPDYNFSIRSSPTRDRVTDYYHWYLTIVPRVAKAAGFEFGSGMYVNTALPEESAAFLRGVRG